MQKKYAEFKCKIRFVQFSEITETWLWKFPRAFRWST